MLHAYSEYSNTQHTPTHTYCQTTTCTHTCMHTNTHTHTHTHTMLTHANLCLASVSTNCSWPIPPISFSSSPSTTSDVCCFSGTAIVTVPRPNLHQWMGRFRDNHEHTQTKHITTPYGHVCVHETTKPNLQWKPPTYNLRWPGRSRVRAAV